jgi:hypothetical protein
VHLKLPNKEACERLAKQHQKDPKSIIEWEKLGYSQIPRNLGIDVRNGVTSISVDGKRIPRQPTKYTSDVNDPAN